MGVVTEGPSLMVQSYLGRLTHFRLQRACISVPLPKWIIFPWNCMHDI
jgi:hypothetical protein